MNWKPSRETWTTLYRASLKTRPDPLPLARHRAGFFMPPIHGEPWPARPASKVTGKTNESSRTRKKGPPAAERLFPVNCPETRNANLGPPAVARKRGKSARGCDQVPGDRNTWTQNRGPWAEIRKKRGGARGDRVKCREPKAAPIGPFSAARRPSETGVKSSF